MQKSWASDKVFLSDIYSYCKATQRKKRQTIKYLEMSTKRFILSPPSQKFNIWCSKIEFHHFFWNNLFLLIDLLYCFFTRYRQYISYIIRRLLIKGVDYVILKIPCWSSLAYFFFINQINGLSCNTLHGASMTIVGKNPGGFPPIICLIRYWETGFSVC